MAEPVLPESIVDGQLNHEPHHEALHAFHNAYINPATGDMFVPNDFGGAAAIGATGPTGPTGIQGPSGATGPAGGGLGVNIKAAPYNAVGDGVADDSAAIQAAINSIDVNRGGAVYVPQGLYYLATGLTCATKQGLELIGEGQTGVTDDLAKGSTQFIVGDGQVGLTLGSSGTTHFRGHRVSNIHFWEKNAGQALGGLHLINVCDSYIDRVACGRFTTGYGIFNDSIGSFSQYNTYIDCRVGRCLYGYRQIAGIGCRWIGGQGDGGKNGTSTPLAGSIGFWIQSGDSFRATDVLAAGYETLWDLGPQHGHSVTTTRCEYWTQRAVRVRPGARAARISGTGDNSLIGQLGAGVVIEATSATLAADITGVATSLTINAGPEGTFPAIGGVLVIGSERIAVGTRSGTTFSGLIRGFEDSGHGGAAPHTAGTAVTSAAEDTEDFMAVVNVSGVGNRHVDNGLRTRFPSLVGQSAQASVVTGTLIGKVAHYNTVGAFDGWMPLYSAITGIAVLQHVKGTTNNTTGVTTIAMTVPSAGVHLGNLLVVGGDYGGTTTRTVTCADTKGNTYTVDQHDDAPATTGTPHTFVISAPVTAALVAGDIITVTFSGTVNYPIVYSFELSGQKTSGYVDVIGGATGNSTAPSVSVTTTADYDFIFGACTYTPTTFTAGAGVTLLDENATTNKKLSLLSVPAATAGSYTMAGTLAAASDWAISAVGYKKQ